MVIHLVLGSSLKSIKTTSTNLLRKELITIIAKLFNHFPSNVQKIVSLFDSLGFIIHPEKSLFTPTQTWEFLDLL